MDDMFHGQSSEDSVQPSMASSSRLQAATPCTAVSELFGNLFIKPAAWLSSDKARTDKPTACSPTSQDPGSSTKFGSASFDSTDTTTTRVSKRQRDKFEDPTVFQVDGTTAAPNDKPVRQPKAIYPENYFKNSRSRSISDITTTSPYVALSSDTVPSLPGSPRASFATAPTFPALAVPGAVSSPFFGGGKGSVAAGGEALRFVSIATPSASANSTPRTVSRSCSRNSNGTAVGGGGGGSSARQLGRKHMPVVLSVSGVGGGWQDQSSCTTADCATAFAAVAALKEEDEVAEQDEEAAAVAAAAASKGIGLFQVLEKDERDESEEGELAAAFCEAAGPTFPVAAEDDDAGQEDLFFCLDM